MILDNFKLDSIIFQIEHAHAYELWDRAGAVARQLSKIWPNFRLHEVAPQAQVFSSDSANIQIGITKSTATVFGENAFDQVTIGQLKETIKILGRELELHDLARLSTRATYVKEFETLGEANRFILGLNQVYWPETKVFDQTQESEQNGIELLYRFEDKSSFSVLRLKAEQLRYEADLNSQFVKDSQIKVFKNRAVIDFDRGLLGTVKVEKLNVEDWFKGFQHILRRDIGKVIRG